MSKVIFSEEIEKQILKEELEKVFQKGDKVAVKLHMGEPGNKTALTPEYVKIYTEVLKSIGAEPFLFDSPVKYSSPRNTSEGYMKAAVEKGFDKLCPVVVSNESFQVEGVIEYEVCTHLRDADGVLVLSHVKGHICCGFGGAIKNLGMGAVTRETKERIHEGGKPQYVGGCIQCNKCVEHCPTNHVRVEDNPYFDQNWCCGCSNCAIFCPENAIVPRDGVFDKLLAEAAHMAAKNFKKAYYVNVVKNITELCDCCSDPGSIIMPDVGVLMGKDIVSVEKASLDKAKEMAGKDIFMETHHKSPLGHIEEAEKLGMGEMDYTLV